MSLGKRLGRRLLTVLLAVVLLVTATPLTLSGRGGRRCGPYALGLYRFVQDEIRVWEGGRQWQVYSLSEACRAHDRCYARGHINRAGCDQYFLADMQTVCDIGERRLSRAYCTLTARSLYTSVHWFGWMTYNYP